jgi:hypothetical protein
MADVKAQTQGAHDAGQVLADSGGTAHRWCVKWASRGTAEQHILA